MPLFCSKTWIYINKSTDEVKPTPKPKPSKVSRTLDKNCVCRHGKTRQITAREKVLKSMLKRSYSEPANV